MSIATTDLIAYGAASRPSDDSSASGGAIDLTTRPVFTQLTANSAIAVQSTSASDTMNVTITGRDSTGNDVSETFAATGTVEKAGVQVFERIQSVTVASSAIGTITVKQGAGGATISTIPVGEKGFYALFINSSSAASIMTRYEKLFWYNKNSTLTLTSAVVTLTADPSSKISIGLATAKSDSGSVTNRTNSPAGVTFVSVNVAQNVPGNTLEASTGIGVWIKQTLSANDAPLKSTFTTQLSGTSI